MKTPKYVIIASIGLFLYFIIAVLLDPRFNPWLKIKSQNITPPISAIRSKKVIISTDNAATAKIGGILAAEPDDSLALAILLASHKIGEIEVVGITSTFGNVDGEATYKIIKKQVELSGLNIPVVKGASIAGQADSEAVEFIAKTLKENEDKIILLSLGPVTDFAAVFRKYPELKEKVEYFLLVRSGPYLNKERWFLFSYNASADMSAALFMYQIGANQYSMENEIFTVSLDNRVVKEFQNIQHPMVKFITRDLKQWNLQNKFFPIKGYLSRKGNMCPWDVVWSMYVIKPQLFDVIPLKDSRLLKIKNKDEFLSEIKTKMYWWGQETRL